MNSFGSSRDAKEYLVGRIVAQADLDGVALSDVERKMLYFSETYWTLPDMMEISQRFDETYDQDEYEAKIGEIVRRIRDQRENSYDDERWDDAVEHLAREDHYLLVLIAPSNRAPAAKGRWDRVRLILAGLVFMAGTFALMFFVDAHVHNRIVSKVLVYGGVLGLLVLVMKVGNPGSGWFN